MVANTCVIVTTINRPTPSMEALAKGCQSSGYKLIVVGDRKTPDDFSLSGSEFLSISAQQGSGFFYGAVAPTDHYARKNLGYLKAIRLGATSIIETDDDNTPHPKFFDPKNRKAEVAVVKNTDWVNVYRYFTDAHIWPRGLPLEQVQHLPPSYEKLEVAIVDCPIQQFLVDAEPDVDAVYRLTMPLPFTFSFDRSVALSEAYCPFNSQNTIWWRDAFPLLYLPAYCSFRMTDIWRSFVAQRIAFANNWGILFGSASVTHERNVHNAIKDFADEIPGYLHNRAVVECLRAVPIREGLPHISESMRASYQALVRQALLPEAELPLLDAWLRDLEGMR